MDFDTELRFSLSLLILQLHGLEQMVNGVAILVAFLFIGKRSTTEYVILCDFFLLVIEPSQAVSGHRKSIGL